MSIDVTTGSWQVVNGQTVWVEETRTYPSETVNGVEWIAGSESDEIPLVPLKKGDGGREDGKPGSYVCGVCGGLFPSHKITIIGGKAYCTVHECAENVRARLLEPK